MKLIKSSLTEVSSLYFQTTSTAVGKSFLLKFFARLVVRIFTKSRYEHIGNIIKCPEKFDGMVYRDNQKAIMVKAGEFYIFEATNYAGLIITKLENRLKQPSYGERWNGLLDIQISRTSGNLEACWQDAVNMLGTGYSTPRAVFSALDHIEFVKKIMNYFFNKKQNKQRKVFCSMFAIKNWWKYVGDNSQIGTSHKYNPEEVLNYLCDNKICYYVNTFVKYYNGEMVQANHKFFTIQ